MFIFRYFTTSDEQKKIMSMKLFFGKFMVISHSGTMVRLGQYLLLLFSIFLLVFLNDTFGVRKTTKVQYNFSFS